MPFRPWTRSWAADVEAWVGRAPADASVHLAWVLVSAVVFRAIALYASTRTRVAARG